jgi:hypothetical protein
MSTPGNSDTVRVLKSRLVFLAIVFGSLALYSILV